MRNKISIKRSLAILLFICMLGSMAGHPAPVLAENAYIINESFSAPSGSGWAAQGGWTGNNVTANGQSGTVTLNGPYWIRHDTGGFEDDALYRFVGRIRGSGSIMLRMDFYETISPSFGGHLYATGSDVFASTADWQEITYDFRTPKGATAAAVYLRGESSGAVEIDSASIERIEYIAADFEPEHVFYYTEWETGKLSAKANISRFPALSGGKIIFSVLDDTKTKFTVEKPINGDGQTDCTFPLVTTLAEIGKEYTASAAVYDNKGVLLATYEEPIHRYNRPTYLRADGLFEKNGKTLDPVLMTGLSNSGNYAGAASLGATIATVYAPVTNARLNQIGNIFGDDNSGIDPDGVPDMYTALVLYGGMKPAGHPDKIAQTKEQVQDLKENKNLFGYAIMDEPFANMSPETAKEMLRLSYKTIRDIDPDHPIYLVEITEGLYGEAMRYCDIFFPDIYPAGTALGKKSDYLASLTEKAVELGVKNKKPVYVLHQAYKYEGWTPSGAELRNLIWRGALSGAKGFGYYCFDNAVDSTSLQNTDMGAMLTAFCGAEQTLLFDLFLRGEKKGEGETDGAVWQAITHGNKNYLVVANRSMKNSTTVPIVLTTGASLTRKFGAGTAENHDGFIRVSLAPSDVTVYEVTVPSGAAFIGDTPRLANGDMEAVSPYGTYPEGWERVASGSPAVSTLFSMSDETEAHSGTACAKIGGIAENPYVYYRTEYTHGENYEISFYFKYKESLSVGVPRIEVRNGVRGEVILDGVTGKTYWNTIPGTEAETWVKCTYHFTAPSEGTEPLAICLFGNVNTVCCYDDVVLKPATTGIQYVDAFGETFSSTEEYPTAVLGGYFPKDKAKTKILLSGVVYREENNIKELLFVEMAEAETEGKAVTLKTWLDIPKGTEFAVEGFLWKDDLEPIL